MFVQRSFLPLSFPYARAGFDYEYDDNTTTQGVVCTARDHPDLPTAR